ncbi:MAG: translocation/assembly module TamB domain-containing protein [Pseudomonadota bacterium]|nr:translocation/assembly module TamB domain-containing protein [Pseudomonadota bacterium]
MTSAAGGLRFNEAATTNLIRYDALELTATFTPERLQAELGAVLMDDGRIDATLATGWDEYAPLAGQIVLDVDELTWMELLSPDIVAPEGRIEGRIGLSGTRAEPLLDGSARLSNFNAELPALGIQLQDGDVRLDARPDGTARIAGSVGTGDGTLRVDGSLGWQGGDTPLLLNITGQDVLVADTRDLRAVISPDVVVRYDAQAPLRVTGTVVVDSARIDLERLDRGASVSPDVVVLDPIDPEEDRGVTALSMDLTLVLGDEVVLDGFGFEGSLDGRLQVLSKPGRELAASGRLQLGGEYAAFGQELEITRGVLSWSGGPIADPLLDIRAQREIGEVTAGVAVSGRVSTLEAKVWADPATTQSEALSYLTLGRPLSSVSGAEGEQLDATSAALTAGGGLIASRLGARLGLDDAGVSQSRALGGSVLGVGKFLSPRLYVSYGVSLLGTGQVLTLKYLLRRGFNLEIESSTVENRASVNWRTER